MSNYYSSKKFEGQALWVAQAYESSLEGVWYDFGNVDFYGYHYSVALVDDEMKDWNLDVDTYAVCITSDESGFVYGDELTQEQYKAMLQYSVDNYVD